MISVVMPVYNGQRFLAQAMDSLLAQTFTDFEVIAVDDGSTDETPAILRAYADRDARVRVIRGDHAGISAALNRGIEASTHQWIARIDADDVASPDRFAKQIAAARRHPEVVVWGSYANHVDAHGNVLGLSKCGPTSVEEFRKLRAAGEDCYVIHPTSMLRKDIVLKAGGYDSRFNFCEDFELFDRMAEHGAVVALPEPLLLYRIHATSISMQRFFTMRRFSNFVRARAKARLAGKTLSYEQFEDDAKRRCACARAAETLHTTSGFYYRKAGLAAAEGDKLKAVRYLAASAALNPFYAVPRVWNQVVAGKLGRLLRVRSASAERLPETATNNRSAEADPTCKASESCCPS
jgi:glycosyltransferase involved in cell wall biosynthesis